MGVTGGVPWVCLEVWHDCAWRCGMIVLGGVSWVCLGCVIGPLGGVACAWRQGVCLEVCHGCAWRCVMGVFGGVS